MRKINPNRMELLRLKKRKVLAQRGHSLLEDKLEKLILEYHRLIKEFKEVSQEFENIFGKFIEEFIFLKAEVPRKQLEELFESAIAPLEVQIKLERLFSVNIPIISFTEKKESYSPLKRPPQWDRIVLLKREVLEVLFKLTQIYIAIERASREILKTRRRVNALEYILIPLIDNNIKSIVNKLTEIEREFLSQILRIKDLIRK